MRTIVLCMALAVAPATPARGFVSTAALRGTISDSTGGVIIGASVSVRNIDTGVARTTTTNELGIYQMPDLQTGRYDINASHDQFATARIRDAVLKVDDQIRIDFRLVPAARIEVVEVTEPLSLTQTETASDSTVVNQRAIQDLPTDGRQLRNLVLLTPGVDAGWNVSTAANRYGKARENTEGAFSVKWRAQPLQ